MAWDDQAVWLDRNDQQEWRLPWSELRGLRKTVSEGALRHATGFALVDRKERLYPVPVHWLAGYPPELQPMFQELMARLPEGAETPKSVCPTFTRTGVVKLMTAGVLLTLFGSLLLCPVAPVKDDASLVLAQVYSLLIGIPILLVGLLDLIRYQVRQMMKEISRSRLTSE